MRACSAVLHPQNSDWKILILLWLVRHVYKSRTKQRLKKSALIRFYINLFCTKDPFLFISHWHLWRKAVTSNILSEKYAVFKNMPFTYPRSLGIRRNLRHAGNQKRYQQLKRYMCFDCQSYWELEEHDQIQAYCPECGSRNIVSLLEVLEE